MGRAAIATSHHLASIAGMDMLGDGRQRRGCKHRRRDGPYRRRAHGVRDRRRWLRHIMGRKRTARSQRLGAIVGGLDARIFQGLSAIPERGWNSVTVPGVVSCWIALWERFGSLPLETIAAPAIRHARDGFLVTPTIARLWANGGQTLREQPGFAACFLPGGRAPRAGELFRSAAHAATLETIAATGGEAFYRGALADRIVADAEATWRCA